MDGFLAHEVSSIVPEAIEGEKDALITQAMLDAGTLQGTVGDPVYQQIDQSDSDIHHMPNGKVKRVSIKNNRGNFGRGTKNE